eukprot:tig00000076_g2372.t1
MAPAESVRPQEGDAPSSAAPEPAAATPSQPPPPESVEYDHIFVGSSITASLLAGALAQAGKKVLHLEPAGWYGQLDASLDVQQLQKVSGIASSDDSASDDELPAPDAAAAGAQPDVERVPIAEPLATSAAVLRDAAVPALPVGLDQRAFTFDLMPRLIFATGAMVDALIRSNVSSYVDFRAVQGTFIHVKGEFHRIPSSKGDIFQSKLLSLPEKLQLQDIIMYAIALCRTDEKQLSAQQGMSLVKKYISSVGRYGPQPHLIPNYGLGELAQGFSRYCAVFGGIHVLRRPVTSICRDASGGIAGIVDSTGQLWNGKAVHLSTGTASPCWRSVHILGQPLAQDDSSDGPKQQCMFFIIPPNSAGNKSVVHLIQYDYSISCAPADKFVLHVVSHGESAKEDAEAIVSGISLQPLWSSSWRVPSTSDLEGTLGTLEGLSSIPYSTSLDADEMANWAHDRFRALCGPDVPFVAEREQPQEGELDEETQL